MFSPICFYSYVIRMKEHEREQRLTERAAKKAAQEATEVEH